MYKKYSKPEVTVVTFNNSDSTNSVIMMSGVTPNNGVVSTGISYGQLDR